MCQEPVSGQFIKKKWQKEKGRKFSTSTPNTCSFWRNKRRKARGTLQATTVIIDIFLASGGINAAVSSGEINIISRNVCDIQIGFWCRQRFWNVPRRRDQRVKGEIFVFHSIVFLMRNLFCQKLHSVM